MEALNMSYLESFGPDLIKNGFKIVPIAKGVKHPKVSKWQELNASLTDIQKWTKNHDGVGVLTEHSPGVDLDIRDADVANKMVDFVETLIGTTVQRIGEAPKTLLVYRTEHPFTKVQSNVYEDLFGTEHKVEILGKGQQFVAFATHPDTHQPYKWVSKKDLSQVKHQELPVITQEDAVKIIEYFESIVPIHWEVKTNKPDLKVVSDNDFEGLENLKAPADVATIKIKKALRYIPAMDYHTWVRVGMALYHQFDGDVEGFDIWDQWSQTASNYDSKGIEFKWDSFRADLSKNPVTTRSIFKLAKDYQRQGQTAANESDVGRFGLVHASEILKKLQPIPWLVKGVIEQDSTGLVFGDPANFKSFITIDLACHVAAGKDWHGHEVAKGPVIYVAGEGHNGFARRLSAWQTGNNECDLGDMPLYFSEKATGLFDAEEAKKVTSEIDRIVEHTNEKPAMIVIDTLARNFGAGDENSTSDMNVFVNHVDFFLRAKYKCVVLIVHHTGKADKSNARGSSALKGAVDFEYRLDRPDDSEDDLIVEMINTKMKDAPEPAPIWFQGEEKVVGEFDEDVTSLVFKKTKSPSKESKAEKLKGIQSALFNFTKKQVEFDGYIERIELRKLAVDGGICRDRKSFNRSVDELIKKGLLDAKDNEISILEEVL